VGPGRGRAPLLPRGPRAGRQLHRLLPRGRQALPPLGRRRQDGNYRLFTVCGPMPNHHGTAHGQVVVRGNAACVPLWDKNDALVPRAPPLTPTRLLTPLSPSLPRLLRSRSGTTRPRRAW
jgi:hypothetical protein